MSNRKVEGLHQHDPFDAWESKHFLRYGDTSLPRDNEPRASAKRPAARTVTVRQFGLSQTEPLRKVR
jgi:hypothetical protein